MLRFVRRALLIALGCVALNAQAGQESFAPGATYEVGYTSHVNAGEERALTVVLKGIGEAQRQIVVAAYEFTSAPIARALIEAHDRGVAVYVLADAQENSRGYTQVNNLVRARIPVRLATAYKIFHNKFMVIDGQTVETGSFNYTGAASESNAENALLIRQDPALADHYGAVWERLWEEARPQ